jgi:hypothetical protein
MDARKRPKIRGIIVHAVWFKKGHNGVAREANEETKSMKPPRVLIVSRPCHLKGLRYLAAKLEDKTYAFITGTIPVFLGHPLPIDPEDKGTIDRQLDLSALRSKWREFVGDSTSSEKLRHEWETFERESSVVRPPREPYEMT